MLGALSTEEMQALGFVITTPATLSQRSSPRRVIHDPETLTAVLAA